MIRILSASYIDYAEVVARILIRLSLRLNLKPVLYLILIFLKITLILKISVDKSIVLNLKKSFVRTAYVTSVTHVVP